MNNLSRQLHREEIIAECIRAISEPMNIKDDVGDVARAMYQALLALQAPEPLKLAVTRPLDYLEAAQIEARKAWATKYTKDQAGDHLTAAGFVHTPRGPLHCTTWRAVWKGPKRKMVAWASYYALAGTPVTVSEIREIGLAQRPSTRNRARRAA